MKPKLTLQNGDVDYFQNTFWMITWRVGLMAFVANLITTVVVRVLVDVNNTGIWGWRWSEPFDTLWFYSFPGAFISGTRSRSGNEAVCSATAGVLGVVVYPLCVGAFRLAPVLGLINLISCLLLSHAIYLTRRLFGWVGQRSFSPYSSLNCVKCGYWLPGLSERRCPECGMSFGKQELE